MMMLMMMSVVSCGLLFGLAMDTRFERFVNVLVLSRNVENVDGVSWFLGLNIVTLFGCSENVVNLIDC